MSRKLAGREKGLRRVGVGRHLSHAEREQFLAPPSIQEVAVLLDEGPSMCDSQLCLYNTPLCILVSEQVLQNLRNVLSAK